MKYTNKYILNIIVTFLYHFKVAPIITLRKSSPTFEVGNLALAP
jgi:hypothetical protein